MPTKTNVTTSLIFDLKSKSDNPIYNDDMSSVHDKFTTKYPDLRGLDILTMRSILAGDVEPVKISGTKNFELWLTSELPLLDQLNAEIKIKNREIRQANKIHKQKIKNAITDDRGRIDPDKMISFLNASKIS